jgi:hypothetical protein
MANEDIIGITVNGETVANFSVPNVGHKLKAGEYQIVNVGGILEISVALVNDGEKFEFPAVKKEIPLEIPHTAAIATPESIVTQPEEPSSIVPLAVPPKKARKPREPKQKEPEKSEEQVVPPVETRAPEKPHSDSVVPPVVSGDANSARLSNLKKMIGFYCKAKGMNPKEITVAILRKEAPDIGENDSDETMQSAIDSFRV